MIIGFFDITGKGRLTSQLCFLAGLFSQYSEKRHLLISRKPIKAQHYLGVSAEESKKKRNDLVRLATSGQLTTQLLRDHSIPLAKGLDYLDAFFIEEKGGDYQRVLYEYLLEKADEGYPYVFADLGDAWEMRQSVDKIVLCLPQSKAVLSGFSEREGFRTEKGEPLLLAFGSYYPESKWTKNRLSKGIDAVDSLGTEFSYELFDAFQEGNLLDYLKRKYADWEKEYKTFAKFVNGGEERRK